MKTLTKSFILSAILIFYSFLYWATSVDKCGEDCVKQSQLSDLLTKNRSYVYGASRCYSGYNADTLCVYVKDTTGINWNLFADTACLYASSVGFSRQTILVLNNAIYPPSTLARKQCP
jgi:hypothetical protein